MVDNLVLNLRYRLEFKMCFKKLICVVFKF